MENAIEKSSKVLRNLIVINHDRFKGYQKASEETSEDSLKGYFSMYSQQSKEFSTELEKLIPDEKYKPDLEAIGLGGKLRLAWMDLKVALSGNSKKGILASCECGEDLIKKAYDEILENETYIPLEIQVLIRKQREKLQEAHNKIKSLRDQS